MDRFSHKIPFVVYLISIFALTLQGCANLPAALDPKGNSATQIANLGWIMFGVGTVIWIVVVALLLIGLFRRNQSKVYTQLSTEEHARAVNIWIVGGGIVMPLLTLIGVIALTIGTLRSIPVKEPAADIVVEVIGHQWWWEVKYPGYDMTLKDEIRIPAGEPIAIRLTSADVIHSFWAPELHGKFDLIPGRVYEFVLQADQPGEYAGRCAEFCGLSHAHMTFLVVAMEPEEFMSWLGAQGGDSNAP